MSFSEILEMLQGIFFTTGISGLGWQHVVMWAIGALFLYWPSPKTSSRPAAAHRIRHLHRQFPTVPSWRPLRDTATALAFSNHYGWNGSDPLRHFPGTRSHDRFRAADRQPKTLLIGRALSSVFSSPTRHGPGASP